MIKWRGLFRLLLFLILGLSCAQVISLFLALAKRDAGLVPLALSVLFTLTIGTVLYALSSSEPHELSHREGIFLVVAAWISVSILGALPFYFSPHFPSFTDALFESISGFTTTGASVLTNVEALPRSLLFWRSFTHWLGGMGIILLMLAVLPLIGAGGMQLYRAEFSGARSDKLKPRVAEVASSLWTIYLVFSVLGYLALRLAGLGPFDAVCHMFGALGTGGFSTRNSSVAAFDSSAVEFVIIVLMVVGGLNFTQHWRLWVERRPKAFFQDSEIRAYFVLLGSATLLLTVEIYRFAFSSLAAAARAALFQVTSIMTATGFSSADFGLWSPLAQLLLLALMFCGGCTGSTAGGLKTARIVLLTRVVKRQFRQMMEPRAVFSIRFSGESIDERTIASLLSLVYTALLFNFSASLLLTATGVDIITAISAVASAMFSVGPGLAEVGPAKNYGHLPTVAKWVLSFCMLAGRLEMYTFLVLLTPGFWRK